METKLKPLKIEFDKEGYEDLINKIEKLEKDNKELRDTASNFIEAINRGIKQNLIESNPDIKNIIKSSFDFNIKVGMTSKIFIMNTNDR